MRDVLIINLTRMGDLVQTTPVMAGLKERYPGVRISLLVSSVFAEICSYIPYIDRLFIFNTAGFEKMVSNGGPSLVGNFRYMERLLREINETEYDLTINFTHSTASAVLTSLIKTKELRGFSIDDEGHGLIRHPWIRYFFNVVPSRKYNPFHLCDLYIKAGGGIPENKGLHLDVSEKDGKWVRSVLRKNGISDEDILIGFQLGASQDNRRWPVSSFAKLADVMTETLGAKFVLIGGNSEGKLGEEFERLAEMKPVNFIGKTNLNELAALLKRCNLLISNDTGPLHISTAVGTKVIGIFLATAHFRETGPYGCGHYVIEAAIPCSPCGFQVDCKELFCKDLITVTHLFELAKAAINGRDIEDSPVWEKVQVYYSYFSEDGLLEYRPLLKRCIKENDFWSHNYRHTWQWVLDGVNDYNIDEAYLNIAGKIKSWYSSGSLKHIFDPLKNTLAAFVRLKELSEDGLNKMNLITEEVRSATPNIEYIKERWEGVPFIDHKIEKIGHTQPPLYPMTLMFKYGKEGLEGENLSVLAEDTCNLYNDLRNHASMMIWFIERLVQA